MAYPVHPRLRLPLTLAGALLDAGLEMAKMAPKAFRLEQRPTRRNHTLRPGPDTPLWNELRSQLRPHLRRYGEQVKLARVLALPRQRVNAFITGGGEMPDAERTLQLIAWLIAVRNGRRPS